MTVTRELVIFVYFILFGMVGGMFFDVLRVMRHNRKIRDFTVYLEDIAFWLLMSGGVIWLSYILEAGQIRLYMIIAVFLGKKFGTKLGNKAEILGGLILIGIGIEIFISGVFF